MKTKLHLGVLSIALTGMIAGLPPLAKTSQTIPAQLPLAMSYDQTASFAASRDGRFFIGSRNNHVSQCGPEQPPHNPFLSANMPSLIASSSLQTEVTSLPAASLPGIVKLETEEDLKDAEVTTGHCSATRIGRNWFVTAAHCISKGYDRLVMKAGSEQLSSLETQRIEADYAVCHGDFRGTSTGFANDLALIHVNEAALPALADVPVVAWGETSTPFSSDTYSSARVGGWGLIEFGGELSDFLVKEELDVTEIRHDRIRLASRFGGGPCIGDSGGPLMIDDEGRPVVMGVLSTLGANPEGRICSGDYLANYTNLSAHRDWIFATISDCEIDSARCRRF